MAEPRERSAFRCASCFGTGEQQTMHERCDDCGGTGLTSGQGEGHPLDDPDYACENCGEDADVCRCNENAEGEE